MRDLDIDSGNLAMLANERLAFGETAMFVAVNRSIARVTLVRGDLRDIASARALSRATMRNTRQNLFFAFGYNALGIPVMAGVLYPAFGLAG